LTETYAVASLLTVAGYTVLAALVVWNRPGGVRTTLIAGACLLHAVWAGSRFFAPFSAWLDPILLNGHAAGWAVALLALQVVQSAGRVRNALIAMCMALFFAHSGATAVHVLDPSTATATAQLTLNVLTLATAVTCMLGAVAAAGEAERWALKLVCLPLAGSFAYELFLSSQTLAFGGVPDRAVGLRTVVDAVVMAPVAAGLARMTRLGDELTISHRATFYAVALIAVGVYLMATAIAAWAFAEMSPNASLAIVALGIIVALTLLALGLASGRVRAAFKMLVARHFRRRKYDHYEEWRRFMRLLSEDAHTSSLERRIIRACADPVESPYGTLWWVPEQGRPRLAEMWNARVGTALAPTLGSADFKNATEAGYRVLSARDLHGIAAERAPDAQAPAAAVPLAHGECLLAFVLLGPPRAGGDYDEADGELLMLIAEQSAAHLAEKLAASDLARQRQFARFAQQYAFVAHDLKNILSSLSVLTRNFARHGHKPAFRDDAKITLEQVTDNLRHLLTRLDADRGQPDDSCVLNLQESVRQAAADAQAGDSRESVSVSADTKTAADGPHVVAPPQQLQAVIRHLISNAVDATDSNGSVEARVDVICNEALVEVSDDGAGMSREFIRDELFEPFHSTKPGGFGIGSFQCRQFARERGGDLDVISTPSEGTTMRLRLPLAKPVARGSREMVGEG